MRIIRTRIFALSHVIKIKIRKKGPPANCRLPVDRLEELQCYKFLQAIRQEDFHLIRQRFLMRDDWLPGPQRSSDWLRALS